MDKLQLLDEYNEPLATIEDHRCPSYNAVYQALKPGNKSLLMIPVNVAQSDSAITLTSDRLIGANKICIRSTLTITYSPDNLANNGGNYYIGFNYTGVKNVYITFLQNQSAITYTINSTGGTMPFTVYENPSATTRTISFRLGANDVPANEHPTVTLTQNASPCLKCTAVLDFTSESSNQCYNQSLFTPSHQTWLLGDNQGWMVYPYEEGALWTPSVWVHLEKTPGATCTPTWPNNTYGDSDRLLCAVCNPDSQFDFNNPETSHLYIAYMQEVPTYLCVGGQGTYREFAMFFDLDILETCSSWNSQNYVILYFWTGQLLWNYQYFTHPFFKLVRAQGGGS